MMSDYLAGTKESAEERLPTVLIAEDNADFRSRLKPLLELHGYRVQEAADGQEAAIT
jgi:CheY-like chemotaxis protein